MQLRVLHRASALVLVVFALLHIANHLASLGSVSLHLLVMGALRRVYRQPAVEAVLLACVAVQTTSGVWLVVRGWSVRVGRVAWLQAISGLYLAFFLLVHVGAVLLGRAVFDLDTNFYFAAAGFHVQPFQWYFAPYYSLAVVALFAHLGSALYWQLEGSKHWGARVALSAVLGVGALVAVLICLSLAGAFETFDVPAEYKSMFGAR